MNYALAKQKRVLAIDPFSRGFGFAIMEGPERLVDWGLKEAREEKNVRCLRQTADLVEHYQPDVVVVEDWTDKDCRRCPRVQELIRDIRRLAISKEIRVESFSRKTVKIVFSQSGSVTKDEIVRAIVERLPELAPWQPPLRKIWMSEDRRTSIFDAVALAFTFFGFTNKR